MYFVPLAYHGVFVSSDTRILVVLYKALPLLRSILVVIVGKENTWSAGL